ncbi:Hypothetical predicted protein [Paramuricea clavata]|uniref:Uncharacterized protein n=1 Tax=Paramuricea clavata TaxID=317549 RepID=A0A6S7G459_PARCT|nr:Hypothetical predicted protein [Paramuricea clavata]
MASEDWTTVYSALDVDEKVSAYNSIIIKMLDEFLPEKTIRAHHSDKPWITGNIKMQIKAPQKAFSRGDQPRYKQLCEKVANLIAKAKATYYRSKASEFRTSNQSKCKCRKHNPHPISTLARKPKLLKETLHGMELSKSPINIAIDNMNNQPTITDNDSVVLIDIEESEVNVNTNMNNLPSATDKEKQYNTRGPVVNDSLMKSQ